MHTFGVGQYSRFIFGASFSTENNRRHLDLLDYNESLVIDKDSK